MGGADAPEKKTYPFKGWEGGMLKNQRKDTYKAARAFQRLSVVLAVCWRCGWGFGVLLELFES